MKNGNCVLGSSHRVVLDRTSLCEHEEADMWLIINDSDVAHEWVLIEGDDYRYTITSNISVWDVGTSGTLDWTWHNKKFPAHSDAKWVPCNSRI